jgi:23S rRNA (guanosine2251-2'-O)-methyltransferase
MSRRDLQVVGLDAGGDAPVDRLPEAPFGRALVVGAEGRGLRRLVRDKCHFLARIPMTRDTESLNASVAASIALFALTRA